MICISTKHIIGAILWGGWVGWGVAKYAPDRFRSLIIGGYPPLYKKNPAGSEAMPDLLKQGWDAMLKAFESMLGQAWTPETEQRIRANDLDALIALKSSDDFRGIPGFEDVLASLKIPCLLYTGENDKGYSFTPEDVKMLPDAVFVIVPGLDHYQAFMRSDLVVPHIKKFLKNVEQTNKQ
jgi:pimeloyl-ACP methyl ester carboxylesterase